MDIGAVGQAHDRMRIGVFTDSTEPRGTVVHGAELADALVRAGHDVTLFALGKPGAHFFRRTAARLCLLPAAPAPDDLDAAIRQRIAELVRGLSHTSPELDVLHAQDSVAASALLEARRVPGLTCARCPLVRTVHHVERSESLYLRACQERSILEADQLLAVSKSTRDAVKAEFGRTCELVSNGIDADRFSAPSAAERARLRAALGLRWDEFALLSVGGVEPRKNSLRCLAAVARCLEREPRLSWYIAGGASPLGHRNYAACFEHELARLDPAIARRIRRLGELGDDRLRQWYQASDALLCPSLHEGFGLCVLEALATGLPVLSSRRPPFTDWLSQGLALLVDPEDVTAIRAGLDALMTEPFERERRAAAGRHLARRYSWPRSALRHAALYARFARRGPSSTRPSSPCA